MSVLEKMNLPAELKEVLNGKKITLPSGRAELIEIALGSNLGNTYDVGYEVEGKGRVNEAIVTRCKNGVAVNYSEAYMRRRDPDCVVVGDSDETTKPVFEAKYGKKFSSLKSDTLNWLAKQDLIVMPFVTGKGDVKYHSLFIGPANTGFFALALADLQNLIPAGEIPEGFSPEIIIYLAPPFRHTHFDGRQAVVHNRTKNNYEIFAYNLYPGPSAKKGIYSALLHIGERENWLTLHAAAVKLMTPYDNPLTLLHEGASGGGKSEMNEHMEHSENDMLILGKNTVTGRVMEADLFHECQLFPATDDMTMCHPSFQKNHGKLTVSDAENAWFVRVNHLDQYGTNPHFERMCIHPKMPLIFLNIDGIAGSTCLPWEHIADSPGKPCPNPRVIFPRKLVPGVIDEPMEIDYRSFGVRTPPCTKEKPSYGILGFFHILPPALAWLWRLAAPRGYDNPSIVSSEGMQSEGIGTYGPFLTGSYIKQADLLLEQFEKNLETRHVLFPNQHVGAWKVGFMPQWIIREYLARRGNKPFEGPKILPAKNNLLGYIKKDIQVETIALPEYMMDVSLQPEVGEEAYFIGGKMLNDFFAEELKKFDVSGLSRAGRKIIGIFKDGGSANDFEKVFK